MNRDLVRKLCSEVRCLRLLQLHHFEPLCYRESVSSAALLRVCGSLFVRMCGSEGICWPCRTNVCVLVGAAVL